MPRALINVNGLNNLDPQKENTLPDETAYTENTSAPVPSSDHETPQKKAEEKPANTTEDPQEKYANAFPDWDLMPPQVLIRRVTRK